MKEEKTENVVKGRPGVKGSIDYTVRDMEVHLYEYPGEYTLTSEPESEQEVAIHDGKIFVRTLSAGGSLTHVFKHYVKISGSSGSDEDAAYITLTWEDQKNK